MTATSSPTRVSALLIDWFETHHRDLPWRATRDAYHIWLSEIILQQTRVVQGLDYYLRFTERFPTVDLLAAAPIDEVMKLWQGLGYYSRARNLHTAACQVMSDFGGVFPTAYESLRRLKGIGPYTAAAIASFSSGEAVAVVDGNVYRLLSRLYDIDTPIDSSEGIKLFQALAGELLDPQRAGAHNQAMMEFGALHCTPLSPACADCPLQQDCQSFRSGTVTSRPVKQQKVKVSNRYLHYLIFCHDGKIIVHHRTAHDIWQGLHEFVLIEQKEPTAIDRLLALALSPEARREVAQITPLLLQRKHQLTHRTLLTDFYLIETRRQLSPADFLLPDRADFITISADKWNEFAIPKLISDANIELFKVLGCKSQKNI